MQATDQQHTDRQMTQQQKALCNYKTLQKGLLYFIFISYMVFSFVKQQKALSDDTTRVIDLILSIVLTILLKVAMGIDKFELKSIRNALSEEDKTLFDKIVSLSDKFDSVASWQQHTSPEQTTAEPVNEDCLTERELKLGTRTFSVKVPRRG